MHTHQNHLIINSNRWFSAVTDYSLQLTQCFHHQNPNTVMVWSFENSPLQKKCSLLNLGFHSVPINIMFPFFYYTLWLNLFFYFRKIRQNSSHAICTVWTFEGREHTACALHKLCFPWVWRNAKLVRIRGQAQPLKNRWDLKLLYTRWTDKCVVPFEKAREHWPFPHSFENLKVLPYCKFHQDLPAQRSDTITSTQNDDTTFTFLCVGRFDPVKGHRVLMEAFADAVFGPAFAHIELVLLGRSENILAKDLEDQAKQLLKTCEDRKRITIRDHTDDQVYQRMGKAHFGVIPSLGSEVICRVAVEFLRMGTPVLLSDAGALPEIFHAFSCPYPEFCFKAGNKDKLAQALEHAYTLVTDSAQTFHQLREDCVLAFYKHYHHKHYEQLAQWVWQ